MSLGYVVVGQVCGAVRAGGSGESTDVVIYKVKELDVMQKNVGRAVSISNFDRNERFERNLSLPLDVGSPRPGVSY